MKKIIAIAAIFFTLTSATNAQNRSYTVYSTMFAAAVHNSYTDQYVWDAPHYSRLRITISGTLISIDNQLHSRFYLGAATINQPNDDGSHTYQWNATDENGLACLVQVIDYPNGSSLLEVFYSDQAWSYSIPA
jgi:hypothetical protein